MVHDTEDAPELIQISMPPQPSQVAGTGDDATIEECSEPMLEGTSGMRVMANSPKQGFDSRMPLPVNALKASNDLVMETQNL